MLQIILNGGVVIFCSIMAITMFKERGWSWRVFVVITGIVVNIPFVVYGIGRVLGKW